MKRIANYRTGDRAEKFGESLLQGFCAVAPYAGNPFGGVLKEVSMRLGVSIILRFGKPEERSELLPERTRGCRIETRNVVLDRGRLLKS